MSQKAQTNKSNTRWVEKSHFRPITARNKDKTLKGVSKNTVGFLIKIVYEYSLIWIMSDISLLTKWKVVLWKHLKYSSKFFFNFPKIHNFLRNWISNYDNSFKHHILHKHIFKTRHFFSTWSNTKIYYPVPLSMGFSRQEYWSGLPFPSSGDLPYPGKEPGLSHCRQILYWVYQGSPLFT